MTESLTSISKFLIFILKKKEVNLNELQINNFLTEINYILHQKVVQINGSINYGSLKIFLCGDLTNWLTDACKNVNIDTNIIIEALPDCLIFKASPEIVKTAINDHFNFVTIFCKKCDSTPWSEEKLTNTQSHMAHSTITYLKSKHILDFE